MSTLLQKKAWILVVGVLLAGAGFGVLQSCSSSSSTTSTGGSGGVTTGTVSLKLKLSK